MTTIAAAVRPGLGWVAMAVVGVLLAGTGLMLVVLPFRMEFRSPSATDGAEGRIQCPTPLARAFDDLGGANAGWFDFGGGSAAIVSADGYCAIPARTRVQRGVVALAVGLTGTAVASRRLVPLG